MKKALGILAGLIILVIVGGALFMVYDSYGPPESERIKAQEDSNIEKGRLEDKLLKAKEENAGLTTVKPKKNKELLACLSKAQTQEERGNCFNRLKETK